MIRKAALIFALASAGASFLAAPAGTSASYPARLQVSGHEFGLVLSRRRLPVGPAIVQFVNRGEDDHDLMFRRVGGPRTWHVPVTRPGQYTNIRVRLYAGTYRVWCALPGHRDSGMRATFTAYRP